MAVIALVSAKGSPGVTTTVVALARAWTQATGRMAVALDLDPCGGDVAAGALLGSTPPGVGILALATDRTERPEDAVRSAGVVLSDSGSLVIPGVPDAARAGAIPLAWDVVVKALPELERTGVDVLIDGGRLDLGNPLPVWVPIVDRAALLVRPSLPWVAAAHRVAGVWSATLPLGVVVVQSPSPYTAQEVARAVGRPLVTELPFDPRAASVHSDGVRPDRRHERGSYTRAVTSLATHLGGSQEVPAQVVADADAVPGPRVEAHTGLGKRS